jgi:hypothetical protein
MIDASFVDVKKQQNDSENNAIIKEKSLPIFFC